MAKSNWTENVIFSNHAYLIGGARASLESELLEFLENEWQIKIAGNPDFFSESVENLGVDSVHRLEDVHGKKALSDTKRIFILAFDSATREAQNALLKILEEPALRSYFFVMASNPDVLLPTLRSRLMRLEAGREFQGESREFAKKFLEASRKKRMEMVKELAEKIAEGEAGKIFGVEVVQNLEQIVWRQFRVSRGTDLAEIFEDLVSAKKYIGDRASSIKTILEHLALVLPSKEK